MSGPLLLKSVILGSTIFIFLGLGRLFAIEFGKLGARVVLWDINERLNLETLEILESQGVDAYAYTVDISNHHSIYETADKVKKEVGDIEILFNNAGIVSGKKLFENSDEMMLKTMAVNTNALFFVSIFSSFTSFIHFF